MALATVGLRAAPARLAAWAGLAARGRDISTSAWAAHVQAAPAEEPEAPAAAAEAARWRRELGVVRTDWTREEVTEIYNTPLLELIYSAATVHRMHHDPSQVQRCTLLSIKTGGCPENCGYCSQSSHWSATTGTKAEKLMDLEPVYEAAVRAKEAGSTRFCMGAAWRGPSQVGPRQFGRVLDMVRRVRGLGMEVCTTLGMLTPEQAAQLRDAGLTAYNHNLDTSEEYYSKVSQTRTYADRLATIKAVQDSGVSVCAGGILGLGEADEDRVGLLHRLATFHMHPESVPINNIVAVKGTPMENHTAPSGLELARCVATARVIMPRAMVRLSAGRSEFSFAEQALCFMAGANSIFDGDKLLTTPNNDRNEDLKMFDLLGLNSRPAFQGYAGGNTSSREFAEAAGGGCGGSGGCGGKGHAHGEHAHAHP